METSANNQTVLAIRSLDVARGLMLVMLLGGLWVASRVPESWAWENGWFENIQATTLLSGFGIALWACWRTQGPDAKGFWLAVAPLWFILFWRELSWGGTLLPPDHFGDFGPAYNSHGLWYRPAIYPLLGLMLLAAGYQFFRRGGLTALIRLWRKGQAPLFELAVCGFAAALATLAEGHVGKGLISAGAHPMVLEEFSEIIVYFALVIAELRCFRALGGLDDDSHQT